jgi:hypothetical protein
MRRIAVVAVALLSAGAAWGQNGGSEIFVPPAPPVTPEAPQPPAPVQPAPQQPPPGLVQTPLPPPGDEGTASTPPPAIPPAIPPSSVAGQPAPTAAQPGSAANQPAPPDVAPAQPNNWVQGTTAVLGVLNKVDGSTTQLSLPVGGQPQTIGDLSVSVQACSSRPADQIPDAAVFLTVSPAQDGAAPLYHGWMLRSAPGATFVGNAGQTFRVIGCS